MRLIDAFTLVIAMWIVLSTWGGFTVGLSLLYLPLSAVFFYIIQKKILFNHPAKKTPFVETKNEPISIERLSLLAFGLFAIIAVFILFNVQGGYDLSADATPSIVTQLIGDHFPNDYSPYFPGVPFFYQLGLPAIASQLEFIPIPIHVLLWAFALLGIFLSLYYFGQVLYEKYGWAAGLLGIALLVFSRYPMLNLLLGEYPWLLSMGLIAAAWYWSRNSSITMSILAGSAILVHPYIGGVGLLVVLIVEKPSILYAFKVCVLAGILVIPMLVFQLIPYTRLASRTLQTAFHPSLSQVLGAVSLTGIIPILTLFLFLAWIVVRKKKMDAWEIRACAGFGLIFLLYFFSSALPFSSFAGKLLQWGSVLAILGAAVIGAKTIPSKWVLITGILVLFSGLIVLATSDDILSRVHGSKASLEEAQFATAFSVFDPGLTSTLFMSPGAGKMAQFSHKIPADAMSANFTLILFLLDTPLAQYYRAESESIRSALHNRCGACVTHYPSHYIVVNTHVFPLLDKEPIFTWGHFFVYLGN